MTLKELLPVLDINGITLEQMLDPTIIDIHITQVAYVTYCDLADV